MVSKKHKRPTEEELMNIIMYTSRTVWQYELVKTNLENWLNNFRGEVFNRKKERFIALWLLSHFTYYNQNEVTHLCKVVYNDLIHKIVTRNAGSKNPEVLVNDFFEKTNIVPADRVSGSSGFIAYFFRQSNDLPIMTLFNFSIENVSDSIENIIIIDDVTLTAGKRGQMHLFLEKNIKKHKDKKFILITLISSESSINHLRNTFNIEIINAITLDNRDRCFSSESDMFSQFPELLDDCRKFAEHYGNKIPIVHPLGYGNGQYAFGFFYNTPDNTLPIFWGQVNGWKPIVRRFHKNYKDRNYLGNERFI